MPRRRWKCSAKKRRDNTTKKSAQLRIRGGDWVRDDIRNGERLALLYIDANYNNLESVNLDDCTSLKFANFRNSKQLSTLDFSKIHLDYPTAGIGCYHIPIALKLTDNHISKI